MQINIPTAIIESARADFNEDSPAGKWFTQLLRTRDIEADASPADYPDDVWVAYKRLSQARYGNNPPVFQGDQLRMFFEGISA